MSKPTTIINAVQEVMRDPISANSRCLNCMQDKGTAQRCPQCGYAEHQHKNHPLYLKPRTLLKNQYLIGKSLGQGGFGITYVAFDCWLHKKVAIKEYLPSALATRDFLTAVVIPVKKQETAFMQGLHLFIEEARHLARFDHPNIVRVIHFFEANNTGYMVMEYLDGENLTDFLARQPSGHVDLNTTLELIMPILAALTVVHAQQIYHRDISLQNIRLLSNGTPILIDFGAARHVVGENSQTLDLVLKHGYSPIEQYSGRGRIGPWTDIYACGALLYLLLSGQLPPAATDRLAGETLPPLSAHLGQAAIPDPIEQAILQALALQPEHRFAEVSHLQAALQGIPIPVARRPQTMPSRAWVRPVRVGVLTLALFAAGLAGFYQLTQQPSPVPHLLVQAQQQWQAGHFTSPPHNNAWHTYLQILRYQPEQPQALAGLQRLVVHYRQQAETALQNKAFTTALTALQHGLHVQPNDPTLLALQAEVLQQQAHAERMADHLAQAQQALTRSQLAEAVAQYQAILAAEPNHAAATEGLHQVAAQYESLARAQRAEPASSEYLIEEGLQLFPTHVGLLALREQLKASAAEQERAMRQRQQLASLLQQAERHVAALRLTEPEGNNAYVLYQQVLQNQPDHPQALAGLQRIADQYEQLARAETDRTRQQQFIAKGLRVMPTHNGLLAFNQQLISANRRPALPKVESRTLPVEPPSPPSPPPAPTPSAQHWARQGDQALAAQAYALAAQHYQKSLQLQPAQPAVQAQLSRIVRYYQQQAEQAKAQAEWDNSLMWIEKGLALAPEQAALLELQTAVQSELNAATNQALAEPATQPKPETPAKNVIFTPSF